MKKRVKKWTAIMLTVIILLAALPTLAAGADDTSPWMYKIDSQVLERMDTLSEEETIHVWIWFTSYDRNEFERRVKEETGYTESELYEAAQAISQKYMPRKREIFYLLSNGNLSEEEKAALREEMKELNRLHNEEFDALYNPYRHTRNRIMEEMGSEHIGAIMDELGIDRETAEFFDPIVCTCITHLPKSMIFPVAMSNDVTDIYFYDDGTDMEEPIEEATVYERLQYYVYDNYGVFGQGGMSYVPEIYSYEELYTHTDSSGETDWVLIDANIGNAELWLGFGIIGNRVRVMGPLDVFTYGMGVYDAQEHTFYDLSKMSDYSAYEGLREAIDTYGKGRLLGDLDLDDAVTIVDVTLLQRCEAHITEYPDSDLISPDEPIDSSFEPLTYYSDFNRDGERDITDATCIQRYLVGLSYPVGR
ncbi:MAG: hypothetical protein IJH07_02165 [Ruminococcus sp.]|nr:hypothetical protein [Ruminococcus sp.]